MPIYKVKANDTLWKIARKFSVSMDSIVRLNNIKNPDKIKTGIHLNIPDTTTDAMGGVSVPIEPPSKPVASATAIVVNRTDCALPAKEFYPEVVKKDIVVLHFTAGQSARSAFNTWLNNPVHVATAYIVDPDGTIYEVFDPSYWAYHLGVKGTRGAHDRRSVGIEIANVGPLKASPADPNVLNWWPDEWRTRWCRVEEQDRFVKASYRGIDYFASYPDRQLDAVARLVSHLCGRFGIRKTIPPAARREQRDQSYFRSYKGIASHQNFRTDKWDVGPASYAHTPIKGPAPNSFLRCVFALENVWASEVSGNQIGEPNPRVSLNRATAQPIDVPRRKLGDLYNKLFALVNDSERRGELFADAVLRYRHWAVPTPNRETEGMDTTALRSFGSNQDPQALAQKMEARVNAFWEALTPHLQT